MNYFKYFLSKLIKRTFISSIRNSEISKSSKVCSASHLVNVRVERYSYIGSYCTIINTQIGSFCSIADNCIIGGAAHPLEWVSLSPVFKEGRNVLNKNFARHKFRDTKKTVIGNDVWIGNNCLIKEGVRIGNGAVIGMGSVVTKDVAPYAIVAGNPIHLIRMRFNDEIILRLQNSKWWDLSERELFDASNRFNDINFFLKTIEK